MKNYLRMFCLFVFVCCFTFFITHNAFAANVTLPWSTSFAGCSQDTFYPTGGHYSSCGADGSYVTQNVNNANYGQQQISTAANFSGGAGERGWRRWVNGGYCDPTPGVACTYCYASSGSISVSLNNEPEVWVRWYMHWQPGFEWAAGLGFAKLVYIRPFGSGAVMDLSGPDGMTMTTQSGGGMGKNATFSGCSSGCGWNTMNPSGTTLASGVNLGDDSWHSIEFHFKNQTAAGAFDGLWDLWIDGVQKAHVTGINWSTTYYPGIQSLQFMINQCHPTHTTPHYNDIDDIEISNTGYIGPIRPSPARNLR